MSGLRIRIGTGRRTGPVVAAGGVVWRGEPDRREVLLVHRPRYDDWSLPKGKLTPGEHILTGAAREIDEETGHRVVLGPPLGVQRYQTRHKGRPAPKVVHYWAARVIGAAPFEPNDEVDRIEWWPAATARSRLSYAPDADVVDALGRVLPSESSVVLLRHAAAVRRSQWRADDALRRLSPEGVRSAERLVEVLRALGVDRVLSSDAERCLATVIPYAAAAGLTVETHHEISEEGFHRDPSGLNGLARTAWSPGQVTVICSHRPVLPGLARELGLRPGKFSPGAFLVAHRHPSGPPTTERFSAP